jgi:asparagine N-glycosylation enzyme membrane subunit Stt3
MAVANAIALVLVWPFSAGNEWDYWGSFSPLVLSNFQPLLYGLGAFCFGALALYWRGSTRLTSGKSRSVEALLLGVSIAGVAVLFVPGLSDGVALSWDWLSKSESFQSEVAESKALFSDGTQRPEQLLTRLFYLTPILILAMASQFRGKENPAAGFFFLAWTGALAGVTLLQFRFMNSFSVAFSLLLGAALVPLVRDFIISRVSGRGLRYLALGVIFLGIFYAISPALLTHWRHVPNLRAFASGETFRPTYLVRLQIVREDLSRWLRANSPETGGWLDDQFEPEYAVLAPWSMGHVIKYRARRPVLQDNFGDDVAPENFSRATQYYDSIDEDDALGRLGDIPVRYVIVRDPERERMRLEQALRLENRLYRFRGSGKFIVERDSGDAPQHVPALTRHRLVFESVPLLGKPGEKNPLYRVYEIVKGAELVGAASPGEVIAASLWVRPDRGEPFEYQVRTHTDASGNWTLRVPYATQAAGADDSKAEFYRVKGRSGSTRVRVPESAVRQGRRIKAPLLVQPVS